MKNTYILLIAVLLISISVSSQNLVERAYLGSNGEVLKETVVMDIPLDEKVPGYNQLPGWPKKVVASPNFKPFRGVTLADITQNGQDEILVSGFNTMNVFNGDGSLLWTRSLIGTAIYPPTVAVMDGSGSLGIVVVTGGVPNNGRVYYFNVNGDDMPGWPLSFENHWIICGPVIADISGDGVKEIIVQTRTSNNLHVLKTDGTSLNANWPVNLGGTPAVTPSVADIDNDGNMDIVTAISNGTMYAFDHNGQAKPGFPIPSDNYSFSYQSPLLVDFDGNDLLSIVGSTHGDVPKFYTRNYDGTYRSGWPVSVPDGFWTYSPPTVVDLDGDQEFNIFMSRPTGEDILPMLYGFNMDGSLLGNFPISKSGGLEGFISVADIDTDGLHDLVFGSNMMIDGEGFIHAWAMDGSGQLPGFPLRPTGFTFMNGPNLGDVNGDGMLNLVALSYELNFLPTDSTFINVYDLNIPVDQANVLFGTYKGSNDRSGFVARTVAQAEIVVAPASHNFGEVGVGQSSELQQFTISNNGDAAASLSGTSLGGFQPNEFSLNDENNYPLNLGIGESIMVDVTFNPISIGFKTAQLIVSANVNVPAVPLSGTGVPAEPPVIEVSPTSISEVNWEYAPAFCLDLTISNTGGSPLEFTIDIEYLRDEWLSLSDSSGLIYPDDFQVIEVCMDASELPWGFYEALLNISSNDPENPLVVIPVSYILVTAIEEQTAPFLSVYPVPADDKVFVKFIEGASRISVLTSKGQLVSTFDLSTVTEFILDTRKFESGTYLLQVEYDNGKVYRKIIIVIKT